METSKKVKLLNLLLGLCLVLICALGYYNWQLSQRLESERVTQPENSLMAPLAGWPDPLFKDPNKMFDFPKSLDPADSFAEFAEMQKLMDEMRPGFGMNMPGASPRISMEELGDAYVVTVLVPEGQDVELNTRLDKNQLQISGKVNSKKQNSSDELFGGRASFNVLSSSQFSQTMALPENADSDGMTIDQNESEITIKIPKQS